MQRHRGHLDRDLLEKAAAALRPAEREALVISATEQLSNLELGERLGLSEVAAEQLLAAAIRKFDRALARERRKLRLRR